MRIMANNTIKRIIIVLLLLLPLVAAGQKYTISGTVSDTKSGETLIGATVVDSRSGKGTVTNPYGRFSLTLPRGEVERPRRRPDPRRGRESRGYPLRP